MGSGLRARHDGFEGTRRRVALVAVCACLAAAGACAKKPMRAVPVEEPGLVVPVIPQRVFAPLPEEPVEEPQPPEPEVESRPAPSRPPRPRPRPERQPEAKPADPKTEPVVPEVAPPVAPTPPLRTPQIADDTETGKRIRATIVRAQGQLQRVNPAAMSTDARMQYETARRFVDQADGALAARDYMFAAYLADKAEALAKWLVGR